MTDHALFFHWCLAAIHDLLVAVDIPLLVWKLLAVPTSVLVQLGTCICPIRPRLTVHLSTKHGYTVCRFPMSFCIFCIICSLAAAGIRFADGGLYTVLIDAAVWFRRAFGSAAHC